MTRHVHVTGVVQGVGFRPFVYGLATGLGLHGWVCNTSAGVDIVVQGEEKDVKTFVESLTAKAPPLARIDQVSTREALAENFLLPVREETGLPYASTIKMNDSQEGPLMSCMPVAMTSI